jgi:hypothetical protein
MNSLKITAMLTFTIQKATGKKYRTTGNTGDLKNTSSKHRVINDKTALSANIIFKHKFRKARRTLSFTADWKSLATEGNSYLKSVIILYKWFAGTGQNLNQLKSNKQTQNLSLNSFLLNR